jgi:hypothetical protein
MACNGTALLLLYDQSLHMSLGALTDLTGGIINNVTQPQSNIPLMFMLYRRSAARARASRHCSASSLHCYASVFG